MKLYLARAVLIFVTFFALVACSPPTASTEPAVNAPVIATITITPANPSLVIGTTQALTAKATDSSSNPISGLSFTWTSSDTAVATIDTNGLVTAIAPGLSTITASSAGVNGLTKLTVTPVPVKPVITNLTITPSSLPVGGGSVTFAWTLTGTTANLTIDNGVGDVTGLTQKTLNVTSSMNFLFTATNAAGTTSKDVSVFVPPSELYVHPVLGDDSNPGTHASPFKTLTHALSLVQTKQTVMLASGMYGNANGESWPLEVPSEVTVHAADSTAILDGANGLKGLNLQNNAKLENLTIQHFKSSVTVKDATVSLVNVNFLTNFQAIALSGKTQAALTELTFAGNGLGIAMLENAQATVTKLNFQSGNGGIKLTDDSSLTLTGGVFNNLGNGCNAEAGILMLGASTAMISSVTWDAGTLAALQLKDTAKATLNGNTINGVKPDLCVTPASVIAGDSSTLTMTNDTIKNGNGAGVSISGLSTVVLNELSVKNQSSSGVLVTGGTLAVNSGTFNNNPTGLEASAGTTTIIGATFSQNINLGLDAKGTAIIHAHTSIFTQNGVFGLRIAVPADLGSSFQPGLNTIQGNSDGGLQIPLSLTGFTINAVGNTWNPNQQGADAQGQYVGGLFTAPTSGPNFIITLGNPKPNLNPKIQL
jgi:Protein of unknown function (DUF1565)/Bacterial Ig-like domain (group 2)/Right handed beta helix region